MKRNKVSFFTQNGLIMKLNVFLIIRKIGAYVYIYMQWSNEFAKKQKVWHSFKHYTYCSNEKSKQTHMPDKKTCGILKFLLRRFALFFWRARFCEEKFIGISFEIVKMLFQSRNRKRTLKSHKMLLLNEQMPK